MNTQGSESGAEMTRIRAVRLVCQDGWSTGHAAKAVGCSRRSIQLWVQKSQQGRKLQSLRTKKAPGPRPKLTGKQRTRLVTMLKKGPEAAGFLSQLWTGARVALLIEKTFEVTCHPNYLPALLRSLGMTVQRTKSRPSERNEKLITHWVNHRWPAIKKSPPTRRLAGVSG